MHNPVRSALRNTLSRLCGRRDELGSVLERIAPDDDPDRAEARALGLASQFPELGGLVALLHDPDQTRAQARKLRLQADTIETILQWGQTLRTQYPTLFAALGRVFPCSEYRPTAPPKVAPVQPFVVPSPHQVEVLQALKRLTTALLAGETEPILRAAGTCYALALAAEDEVLEGIALLAEQAESPVGPAGGRYRVLGLSAGYLAQLDRWDPEAVSLLQQTVETLEKTLGPNHPREAQSLNNLAHLLKAQGKLGEAEPLYRRSLSILEQTLGPNHPDVAQSLNNLALLFQAQGKLGEAAPLYRRSIQIFTQSLGPEHPRTKVAIENLQQLQATQKSP